jgi:hypothetical protein
MVAQRRDFIEAFPPGAASRVPDAVQRRALARWCTADPGPIVPPTTARVPVLLRTTPLRYVLRSARDTRLSGAAGSRGLIQSRILFVDAIAACQEATRLEPSAHTGN